MLAAAMSTGVLTPFVVVQLRQRGSMDGKGRGREGKEKKTHNSKAVREAVDARKSKTE